MTAYPKLMVGDEEQYQHLKSLCRHQGVLIACDDASRTLTIGGSLNIPSDIITNKCATEGK